MTRLAGSTGKIPYKQRHNGSLKLLAVDDNEISQRMMQHQIVKYMKQECALAMSAEEALQFLEREETLPDLILLDVNMPHMNGFELCALLRKLFTAHALPIIVVTGHIGPGRAIEAMSLGANDFVMKPINPENLAARILAQLDIAYTAKAVAAGVGAKHTRGGSATCATQRRRDRAAMGALPSMHSVFAGPSSSCGDYYSCSSEPRLPPLGCKQPSYGRLSGHGEAFDEAAEVVDEQRRK